MMEDAKLPRLINQKEQFLSSLVKKFEKGDVWYLIDSKWFKQWKRYVGYDSWDKAGFGEENINPGPMDNSNILLEDTDELKENLIEDMDYIIISNEAWDMMYMEYGLAADQEPIKRRVIEYGFFNKQMKVEIYLLNIKLCQIRALDTLYFHKFSKLDTVYGLEKDARKVFHIPEDEEIRLWHKYDSNAIERLDEKEKTLQELGFEQNQVVIVERRTREGAWPLPSKQVARTPVNRISSNDILGFHIRPGLCGLSNLGNTCFMNSALQCMSNASLLTQYFLEETYWEELNTTNPLGMKGEIAKCYAELIKVIWSGRYAYTVPNEFKNIVGKFAPQFSGYQQQDCQELMAFILDGLHEDLNRVKKKPFVEVKDTDGRPDQEVAEETWANYLQRNNSIIVDIFHGLLKSTVVCPDCAKVSITFDPFCYLSLPLPVDKERALKIIFIPKETNALPIEMLITLPKYGCIQDLLISTGTLMNIEPNKLLVADVYNSRLNRIYHNDDALTDIVDRDDTFVYEIPLGNEENPIHVLPLYFREILTNYDSKACLTRLFGHPLLIQVPLEGVTYEKLYELILGRIQRFLEPPVTDDDLWKDSSEDVLPDITKASEKEDRDSDDATSETLSTRKLFKIESVNGIGNVTLDSFKEDEGLLNITSRTYLAIDWEYRERDRFYSEENARQFEIHESMNVIDNNENRVIHLTDCLDLFTSTEQLGVDDPWYCSHCQKHQQATKKFDLWLLPNTLIIHLKRFSYNNYWREKIEILVTFPFYGLDMNKYIIDPNHEKATYELVAVANHFGAMGGGHYTAFAKNKYNGKWFNYDDGKVSLVHENSVMTKAAYVLFYQKTDILKTLVEESIITATNSS